MSPANAHRGETEATGLQSKWSVTKEAGVGLFALVLADCPPAGQSKLLKKLVHLFRGIGHIGDQPPFEQRQEGCSQIVRHDWWGDGAGLFRASGALQRLLNHLTYGPLGHPPERFAKSTRYQRLKLLEVLLDMLEQFQARHHLPLPTSAQELLEQLLKELLDERYLDILFIKVMSIKC